MVHVGAGIFISEDEYINGIRDNYFMFNNTAWYHQRNSYLYALDCLKKNYKNNHNPREQYIKDNIPILKEYLCKADFIKALDELFDIQYIQYVKQK